MSNSEIIRVFDERRKEFTPYGLTCERWRPMLMRRPDRHNEIELNLLLNGSLTYLIWGRRVRVHAGRLAVFWGIAPHQIIDFEGDERYYVATIPSTRFLQWKLPPGFFNSVLCGSIVEEATDSDAVSDLSLFERWILDVESASSEAMEIMLLEMEARMRRLALTHTSQPGPDSEPATHPPDAATSSKVEQMALYVAKNYTLPVQIHEIGQAVGLHPDYANVLFRETFGMTLGDYILEHRISHAQRLLSTTREKTVSIAFSSGFGSVSRFNAAFKKVTGLTPRQYRNTHKSVGLSPMPLARP